MEDFIDILNREKYIETLLETVDDIENKKFGCCFAIDGQWGRIGGDEDATGPGVSSEIKENP